MYTVYLVDKVAGGAGLLVELEVVPNLQHLPAGRAPNLSRISAA